MDSPGLGVGLAVIARITDTFHVREPVGGGTELRMTFALPVRKVEMTTQALDVSGPSPT